MKKNKSSASVSLDEIMKNQEKYFTDHPKEIILDNLIIYRITLATSSGRIHALLVHQDGGKNKCVVAPHGQADRIATLSRIKDVIKIKGTFERDGSLFYILATEIENYEFPQEHKCDSCSASK